ncbi:MAG: type II secretion system minor pseudopilin GspJ [Gammaproteobacteria bacterium]|nr:type II secretion system minor pseudopilin GspJ [Gammaproteobacteria bacterium]MCW9029905.1 type II secretion system minor pseudopilin GspJ [Gammaproteobacteria bacterium]
MIVRKIHLMRGFTLLELLVALSIFSLVSVMAYGGLQTVIKTKNITQQSADRIAEVQLLMMRISDDLRQAVSRKIRDEYGDFLPAMQSGKNGNETIAWTRLGYRNPARLTRSNIQRVAYKLEQQKLVRITWPVLDRAQDTKELNSEVLSNVESIEWRFMNNNNEWLSTWPDEGENMVLYPLPKAVEVTLELQDWGKIKRLILVASDT